jgi:hypothetical protein
MFPKQVVWCLFTKCLTTECVTENESKTLVNLVTWKAGVRLELASEAGLLNKSSCSAAALGVNKYDLGHTLLCCLSPTYLFKKIVSEAGLLNKSSFLSAALGVTKFVAIIVIKLRWVC